MNQLYFKRVTAKSINNRATYAMRNSKCESFGTLGYLL